MTIYYNYGDCIKALYDVKNIAIRYEAPDTILECTVPDTCGGNDYTCVRLYSQGVRLITEDKNV